MESLHFHPTLTLTRFPPSPPDSGVMLEESGFHHQLLRGVKDHSSYFQEPGRS